MFHRCVVLITLAVSPVALAQSAPPAQGGPAPTPDPYAAVAPARAQAQASVTRLGNARDALSDYVRTQRFVFESSPEYRDALAEQRSAYEAWAAARSEAIASLDVEPDYAEAVRIRDDLGRQVQAERAKARPDAVRLGALAEYRLTLGRKISAREAEVLAAADTAVVEARKRLSDATNRLDRARREFAVRLRTAPEFASAKSEVRVAAEQQAYALTLASETARTADVLLRYAYYAQYLSTVRPYVISTGYLPYYPTAYSGAPAVTTGIGYGLMPGQ